MCGIQKSGRRVNWLLSRYHASFEMFRKLGWSSSSSSLNFEWVNSWQEEEEVRIFQVFLMSVMLYLTVDEFLMLGWAAIENGEFIEAWNGNLNYIKVCAKPLLCHCFCFTSGFWCVCFRRRISKQQESTKSVWYSFRCKIGIVKEQYLTVMA